MARWDDLVGISFEGNWPSEEDRQRLLDEHWFQRAVQVYLGQGEPWQGGPRKESPYYNEKLATQYTEYSVAKANEYLDKAFPKKDAQGFRLGPDGKRITFAVLVIPALGDFVDAAQLVGQYWQAVGVDAKIQTVDRTLFYDRKDHNDQDGTVFQSGFGALSSRQAPLIGRCTAANRALSFGLAFCAKAAANALSGNQMKPSPSGASCGAFGCGFPRRNTSPTVSPSSGASAATKTRPLTRSFLVPEITAPA